MVTGASHNRVELCICMCACHGFESLADTALRRYCKLEVRSPAEGPELRHRTGRERTSSPTLQTLQDPILPLSWVCFRGGGFQTLADEGLQGEISAHMLAELQAIYSTERGRYHCRLNATALLGCWCLHRRLNRTPSLCPQPSHHSHPACAPPPRMQPSCSVSHPADARQRAQHSPPFSAKRSTKFGISERHFHARSTPRAARRTSQ